MPRGLAHHETVVLEKGAAQTAPDLPVLPAPAHHADDEARLRQLGYKQELRRELNLLKNFAVSNSKVRGPGAIASSAAAFGLMTLVAHYAAFCRTCRFRLACCPCLLA